MLSDKTFKIIIFTALSLLALHVYSAIILPVIFSVVLALALLQPSQWLESKGIHRILAAIMVLMVPLVLFVGLGIIYYFQFDAFTETLPDFSESTEEAVAEISNSMEETTDFDFKLVEKFNSYKENASNLLKSGTEFIKSTFSAFTEVISLAVLIPIYVFFLLISRDSLIRFVKARFKGQSQNQVFEFFTEGKRNMMNYFKGMATVIVIVAVLNTTALYIIGIDYAILLGSFSALLIIIPYFGVALGALIPILVAFLTKDSISYPLYVMLAYAIIQMLEGNVISPKLLGDNVNLSPLAIIFFLIFMGFVGGIFGMIVAVPLLALIKLGLEKSKDLKDWALLICSSQPDATNGE